MRGPGVCVHVSARTGCWVVCLGALSAGRLGGRSEAPSSVGKVPPPTRRASSGPAEGQRRAAPGVPRALPPGAGIRLRSASSLCLSVQPLPVPGCPVFCPLQHPLPSLFHLLFKPLFLCDSGSPRPVLTSHSTGTECLGRGTCPRYHRYGCLCQPCHLVPPCGTRRK